MSDTLLARKTAVLIKPEYAGCRVLDFVTSRFTYRSREEWRQELDAGRFLLGGDRAASQSLLAAGDRLVYLMPELQEPPVDQDFVVLYEDDDLLVVDKPARLPCHPGGIFFRHTLWALLQERHGIVGPSLINRLDRETSGIVLVAKNKKAARHCSQQFASHQVYKRYLALVEGEFPFPTLQANGSLAPDPASAIRKKVRFYPNEAAAEAPAGAVPCSTVLQRLRSDNGISLVEAIPVTGRCHQIRATLCSLGFPVVGDKLYGVDEQLFLRLQQDRLSTADRQRLRLDRQALHAATLRLRHPSNDRELEFSAPLPAAMKTLVGDIGEAASFA
ncbi:MAG: RluA family pseudouridine synthase [Proteobacteria bacterium]|nr:RluA family pseudouridine synthase [Pseudomonadota bacterium]MBU4298028.1 RluA family pseudouridine synthase [Pseudomonadota bacterium]MCG2749588.1 RluA family pseudouridine synthase [Desulfobulbaceae bacterium]